MAKITMGLGWIMAIVSGNPYLIAFSMIPTGLSIIFWLIKIRKETKNKN